MKYLALMFIIFIHCSTKKENELPISIEGEWIEVYEKIEWVYDWSGLKFKNDTAYSISYLAILIKGPYSIVQNPLE